MVAILVSVVENVRDLLKIVYSTKRLPASHKQVVKFSLLNMIQYGDTRIVLQRSYKRRTA